MFAVLSRSRLSRQSLAHTVRWASQKPGQSSGRKNLQGDGKAAAAETPDSAASSAPQPDVSQEPLASSSSGALPSLDFSPSEPHEEPQRTGARSSKGSLSSTEKKRRVIGKVMGAIFAVAFGAHVVYMGREWEEDELKQKKLILEAAPATRWGRTKERFTDLFDYFNKPAWPELLPPPYPAPQGKPYTLLVSMDDLLVTSTWDRQHGWRTAKRPGVDYFLAYISQFYEVVIFTTQASYTAQPILEKLDRYNFFLTHRLFREATRSLNGKIVKDLSYLNRDLSKVIILDTDPEHVMLQPENAIVLPKWKGEVHDKGLVAIIPFLESVAIYKPPDVRPILKAYEGKDIPIEYAKKEMEAKARHIAEWKAKHKGVSSSSMSSWFGLSSTPQTPRGVPPPTYLEQKRKEAQFQYREEQEYVRKNRDQLEKLLEQDQQAAAGQVPNSLWEAIGQFSGNPPPPNPQAPAPPTPSTSTSASA